MTKVKCRKCNKQGITVIDSLANSVFGTMRCQICYQQFSLHTIAAILYAAIGGSLVFLTALYTISAMHAWSLVTFICTLLPQEFIYLLC